jgi:hypothetical protein
MKTHSRCDTPCHVVDTPDPAETQRHAGVQRCPGRASTRRRGFSLAMGRSGLEAAPDLPISRTLRIRGTRQNASTDHLHQNVGPSRPGAEHRTALMPAIERPPMQRISTARSPGAEAGLEAAGATLREISVKCAARCEIARHLSTQPGGRAAGKTPAPGPGLPWVRDRRSARGFPMQRTGDDRSECVPCGDGTEIEALRPGEETRPEHQGEAGNEAPETGHPEAGHPEADPQVLGEPVAAPANESQSCRSRDPQHRRSRQNSTLLVADTAHRSVLRRATQPAARGPLLSTRRSRI